MSKPINKLGYNLSTGKLLNFLYKSRQKWHRRALRVSQESRKLKKHHYPVWQEQLLALQAPTPGELAQQAQQQTEQAYSLQALPMKHDGLAQFQKRFSQLIAMRSFSLSLQQLMELVKSLLHDFKSKGLSKQRFQQWSEFPVELLEPLSRTFFLDWKQRMWPYVDALPTQETYLGSSDLVESLFGHYKQAGEKSWLKGMSANVLMMPALAGSTDAQLVSDALKATQWQDVLDWFEEQHCGQSFLAKRRIALAPARKGMKVVGIDSS